MCTDVLCRHQQQQQHDVAAQQARHDVKLMVARGPCNQV